MKKSDFKIGLFVPRTSNTNQIVFIYERMTAYR